MEFTKGEQVNSLLSAERDPSSPPPIDKTRGEDSRRLVERAKEDPGAFAELYDRHFIQIYRFVYSRVRDQARAEDVTSEVFMKALRGIGRYQDTGRPFSAWLYQIASNAVADSFRSLRPTEDIEERHDLSDGKSLEDLASQRDQLRQVWVLVERLPRQQREAVVLKFQEDLKIEDIAETMGKSPGAVKLLIHRGINKVRQEAGSIRHSSEEIN
ncbi:MAG: RNA polymerase sigma factor [Candidatus Dormibacteraceae bacterium]